MIATGSCAMSGSDTKAEMNAVAVPEGFRPYLRKGASYCQTLGPMYVRELSSGLLVLALRVSEHHCNRLGSPHGGMLATFVDLALGVNLHLARRSSAAMVTVNLNLDYLSASKVSDWLEAHVTPRRLGRQLAFGDCVLRVEDREILRATGIFSVLSPMRSVTEPDG